MTVTKKKKKNGTCRLCEKFIENSANKFKRFKEIKKFKEDKQTSTTLKNKTNIFWKELYKLNIQEEDLGRGLAL